MKTLKNILVALAIVLVGCKDTVKNPSIPVIGVRLEAQTLTLVVGETQIIEARVLPGNADDRTVSWTSNAEEFVTVDEATGEVTAIAEGSANITVTTTDGAKKAVCAVTVVTGESGPDENYDFVREGTEGEGIAWGLTADGLLVISGEGAMKDYTVGETETPDGFVPYSDTPWFKLDVRSLLIEEGITKIGRFAFAAMPYLEEVAIEEGLTEIGAGAFAQSPELTNVTIPESVITIGNSAFYHCSSLISIDIPDSVVSMGIRLCEGCAALESAVIGNGVDSVGESSFEGCTSLKYVTIGDDVTAIANRAFSNCQSLESVTIGNSVSSLGDRAFYACSSLQSIDLPDTLRSIGVSAFSMCSSLESANLGTGLSSLGYNNYGGTPGVFEGCLALKSIVIPNGVVEIHRATFMSCEALTSVTIGPYVSIINANAFDGCSSLPEITIPSSVTFIDVYAFQRCPALAKVMVMAVDPPALWHDPEHPNFDCPNDILHVPAGSVAKYAQAHDWNNVFSDIVEQPRS